MRIVGIPTCQSLTADKEVDSEVIIANVVRVPPTNYLQLPAADTKQYRRFRWATKKTSNYALLLYFHSITVWKKLNTSGRLILLVLISLEKLLLFIVAPNT